MRSLSAEIPASFKKMGNERQVVMDERTGHKIVFLTDTRYVDTLYYPTCRSWTRDGRFALIESIRPRPDGTSNPLERQLLMADTRTGDLHWLATLEVENTAKYGDAHLRVSSMYHADYSPGTDRIVFYDMTGHHLYLLDLKTARTLHLLHMTDGTIGDPPSIAEDGSRVVFYAAHPGPPETDWFLGRTYTIYGLDLEPSTGEAKGRCFVITSYTARKGRNYHTNRGDRIHINHCQINPSDPDQIAYAHEYGGSRSDGSPHKARLWYTRVDGTDEGPLTRTPVGSSHSHEVWGPLGRWLYFVETGNVARIDTVTRRIEHLTKAMNPRASHLTVSRDETKVVVDTISGFGETPDGNPVGAIILVEVATGNTELLAAQPAGRGHPRHPHPSLSPDGKKVGFTVACGKTSRVAYLEVPRMP